MTILMLLLLNFPLTSEYLMKLHAFGNKKFEDIK
jgi:hypothetical protein